MPDNDAMRPFTVRLTESEIAEIEALRERLQTRADPGDRVTQRKVILVALDRLRAHLDRLERDRGRDR